MSNMKRLLALVAVIGFCGTGISVAGAVDCSNVQNKNKDECVHAKVNHRNDVVDCGNAQNGNKDECVRAKANVNHRNDVVDCGNVKNKNKDECVRAKFDHNN